MKLVGRISAVCGLVVLLAASAAVARGLICTGGVCKGTSGSDNLAGSNLKDDIRALAGDDFLFGNGADDILRGGKGGDLLSEEEDPSRDRLLAGKGDDYLEGGLQGDVLAGGPGDDRETGLLRGGLPAFYAVSMFGDPGNDTISGGSGNDSMEGEEGRDKMKGGSGNDYLDAIDDDTPGTHDKLDCGKGFDRFRARPTDEVADNCEQRVPAPPLSPPRTQQPI